MNALVLIDSTKPLQCRKYFCAEVKNPFILSFFFFPVHHYVNSYIITAAQKLLFIQMFIFVTQSNTITKKNTILYRCVYFFSFWIKLPSLNSIIFTGLDFQASHHNDGTLRAYINVCVWKSKRMTTTTTNQTKYISTSGGKASKQAFVEHQRN